MSEQNDSAEMVFLVEQDLATRDTLSQSVQDRPANLRAFGSAEEFLGGFSPNGTPACVLIDERLPGITGSELLGRLHDEGVDTPAILLNERPETAYTVSAMRRGARAVLDKPCSLETLQAEVHRALEADRQRHESEQKANLAKQKLSRLTEAERQVLDMVLEGTPNKLIARRLGVCVRTVEARRSRIYQTSEVASVAELVRECFAAGLLK